MRYDKGHKDATRERIIEVASRQFREQGVAAVGLARIMSDAGLTNGAFYAHFDSKEDLFREVLSHAGFRNKLKAAMAHWMSAQQEFEAQVGPARAARLRSDLLALELPA